MKPLTAEVIKRAAGCFACLLWLLCGVSANAGQPGILRSEFIVESPKFEFSHASTIEETTNGLLVAWAGGSRERALDVSIWMSRLQDGKWTEPQEVADGTIVNEGRRYPAWNPLLFKSKKGSLSLFYKVGPSPEAWWGMVMTSQDGGLSWGPPKRLANNALGPIRSKPYEFENGSVICGSSTESAGWQVHIERADPPYTFWLKSAPLNNAMEMSAIQPLLFKHRSGKMQILCRTKQGYIAQSWSENNGLTWSKLTPASLPNPNGAIDGVILLEGMALMVYNHSATDRNTLDVAVSPDGETWRSALVIEKAAQGEFSYPSVIQSSDGMVHVVYSWNRKRIKHVVMDPWQFRAR